MPHQPPWTPPYRHIPLDQVDGPTSDIVSGWKDQVLQVCRERHIHRRSITPFSSRFGYGYVIQTDAPSSAGPNTFRLLLTSGAWGTFTLLPAAHSYTMATDLRRLESLLAEVEAEYPAGSLTATLAATLTQIMQVWSDARKCKQQGVDLSLVDNIVSTRLAPFLWPWEEPDHHKGCYCESCMRWKRYQEALDAADQDPKPVS